jgi:hypothetical protein
MEIALLIVLFLAGTVGGAMQALKYVELRRRRQQEAARRAKKDSK